MAYTSKYTGKQIDELLGQGVTIVDSEEKLETLDLPQGSLASVAYNTMAVTNFRDMYQPTAENIDQSSGVLVNAELLSSVSELQWTFPEGATIAESAGFYLVPRTFSVENQKMVVVVFQDGAISGSALMGDYNNYTIATSDDTGAWTSDNEAINAFNTLLAEDDWCYFSNPEAGYVITDAQFETIDTFVKSVSGVQGTDLYIREADGFHKQRTQKMSQLENDSNYIKLGGVFSKVEIWDDISRITLPVNTLVRTNFQHPDFSISFSKSEASDKIIQYGLISDLKINFDYTSYPIIWKTSPPNAANSGTLYLFTKYGESNIIIGDCTPYITGVISATLNIESAGTYKLIHRGWKFVDYALLNGEKIKLINSYYFQEAGEYDLELHIANLPDDAANSVDNVYSKIYIDCKTIEDSVFDGITSVEEVELGDKVESIGNNFFYNTPSASVKLGTGIKSIGMQFFKTAALNGNLNVFITDIVAYSNIELHKNNFGYNLYLNEELVTNIDGYEIENIGNYIFNRNKNITTLSNNYITNIGVGAFINCTNLTTVDNYQIVNIGDYAFSGCTNLEKVNFKFDTNKKLANIGTKAFFNCTSLKSVDIGSDRETVVIGEQAFQECTGLTEVILTNVNVPFFCFYNCVSLKKVILDGVQRISGSSFSGCPIEEISLDGCLYIGEGAFASAKFREVRLGSISIIHEYTFSGCTNLEYIDFGNVTKIENYAFRNCTSLKEVYLKNVYTIGDEIFDGCANLKKLKFGHLIKEFGTYVCNSAEILDFSESVLIPTIKASSFGTLPETCQIIVPDALYDEWIVADNWADLASQIVKASEYVEPTNE